MQKWPYLILIASTLGYAVSPFYVVGENYVSYFNSERELSISRGIHPSSWTLDRKLCRLWVTSEEDSNLVAFENGNKWDEIKFTGKIISDVVDSQFATNNGNNLIEFRDPSGHVKSQVFFENLPDLKQIHFLPGGGSWNLFQRKTSLNRDSLWVNKTDDQGTELKKIFLEASQELWGRTIFSYEKTNQRLWIGYTRSTPQHMYSPYVVQLSSTGEKEFDYQWTDRGVLFDGCVEPTGDFSIFRDIPSPEFTVPLYSYLELLPWKGIPVTRLALSTNLLVNSMDCRPDGVYVAVHSVLGGEPHQILHWDRNPKSLAEPLVTVPPKIQEVLTCD